MTSLRDAPGYHLPKRLKKTQSRSKGDSELTLGRQRGTVSSFAIGFFEQHLSQTDVAGRDLHPFVVFDILQRCLERELTSRFQLKICLLYTSPSPRDATLSRMPSSA